jgi:deazaflavin-dependent oxidoreductase (nitroreductase family)
LSCRPYRIVDFYGGVKTCRDRVASQENIECSEAPYTDSEYAAEGSIVSESTTGGEERHRQRGGVARLVRSTIFAIGHHKIAFPLRRMVVAADRLLYRRTGGKWSVLAGSRIPSLTLLISRPNGGTAVVPLRFVRIDGHIYVVGSNWGRRNHPLWTNWLKSNGDCTINIKGREAHSHARLVDGAERLALWPQIVAAAPDNAQYERTARRELRIFQVIPRNQ